MHDDGEFSDKNISKEDVVKVFRQLYLQWKEECYLVRKKEFKLALYFKTRKILSQLSELKEEGMTKSIHMLNCGSEILDEIFGFEKSVRDVKEIDFDCSTKY